MQKTVFLIVAILTSVLLAGLYGILHDQITLSVSEEYFSKFKYRQFHIGAAVPFRLGAIVIGFKATWWTGIIIGLGIGIPSLRFALSKERYKIFRKALLINFSVAALAGLAGFFYGKYILVTKGVSWFIPHDVLDKNAFIIVGSIHNFSYMGALAGLISAMLWLIWQSNFRK